MPQVRGHYRRDGTYVRPDYRRGAPWAYRDNGQVRVPRTIAVTAIFVKGYLRVPTPTTSYGSDD